jgi:TRAP-type C4-dicarboxylate transport system permease small subunit
VGLLLQWLDRWERRLCVTAFTVLAADLITDVLLRELTGNGIPWAHQTGIYANLVVALFGMGLATSAGSHLRPRFTDHWLPESWQPTLLRLGFLITALFLAFFALLALQLVLETRGLGETATVLRIPLWPLQSLIAVSFGSAALRNMVFSLHPQLAPVES